MAVEFMIVCDDCAHAGPANVRELGLTPLRQEARKLGWLSTGSQDVCPACRLRRLSDNAPSEVEL